MLSCAGQLQEILATKSALSYRRGIAKFRQHLRDEQKCLAPFGMSLRGVVYHCIIWS